MNTGAYLERIGLLKAKLGVDTASLQTLQRAHLLAVPFENLDIHWKRPIKIDIAKFYDKIVVEKRGGFCYELNGLFNELLRDLGFETRIVSARVHDGKGGFSPEYDHAAIIATVGDEECLTDVGFGSFTAEPLRLVLDVEQKDATGTFVIRAATEDGYFEVAKKQDGDWRAEYIFKPQGRELSEFADRCDFQQYAPESHFRKGKLCSIMTESGRKTLTDKSLLLRLTARKTKVRSVRIEGSSTYLKTNSRSTVFGTKRKKSTKRNTFVNMYYMRYETTITSKGTITIAAPIRKALNLRPGRKVRLSLDKDKKLLIDPGLTVEEFEIARERLVSKIPKHLLGLTGKKLKNAIEAAKTAEYKKKHLK